MLTFLNMLRTFLFPHFRIFSLTFLLLCLHITLFSLCIYHSGISHQDPNDFLALTQSSLFTFGENYPYFLLREYEYWRLLTNPLLAANFSHLACLLLTLLMLGSYLERQIGLFRYLLLFLFASVSGSLESALFIDSPSVGGSFFSLAGIGSICAMGVYYQMQEIQGVIKPDEWRELMGFPSKYPKEFQYIINALWAINLLVGINNRNIDLFGNAMSVVNGYFMGWVLVGQGKNGWELLRTVSPAVVIAGLFIASFYRNPDLF